jgi:hypothetical protein
MRLADGRTYEGPWEAGQPAGAAANPLPAEPAASAVPAEPAAPAKSE